MPGGKNDLSKTILRGIAKYQRWSALTIKKRDADHYAIWLEHARKLETFVRNIQIQLRIIIIKTFHLEFNLIAL